MNVELSIGGVRIRIEDPSREWRFAPLDPHAAFVVNGRVAPDILLAIRREGELPAPRGESVYSTEGGLWNLHREDGDLVFSLGAPAEGGALHRIARLDPTVTRGEVRIGPAGEREGYHPYPLRYPLDELILINHLAQGRGTILHACGARLPRAGSGGEGDARGLLFVGKSGAGKSTLAKLWGEAGGAEILSDDRVILRPEGTGARLYGTPWHGDARVSSAATAPLDRIFLLAHGTQNRIAPVGPEEALETLLLNCFAPFYDRAGMEWTIDFIQSLLREVSVARLEFVPDGSAIRHLREALA